jgi:hypothetical protein
VQAKVARVAAGHQWGLEMESELKKEWANRLSLSLADRRDGKFSVWADEGVARGFALHFRVQVGGFHAEAIMRWYPSLFMFSWRW